MTARWVVDIADERDIAVTWRPISLYFKNEPDPDSEYHDPVLWTHKLLRVMESVRATERDDAVFDLYWEYGRRIHHDGDRDFSASEALDAVELSADHAAAFEDETFDPLIREAMDEGLALAGDDIGTPLLGYRNDDGERVGFFGPVITRVMPRELNLKLWDGIMELSTVPGFWELKRTRTERPDFGERP